MEAPIENLAHVAAALAAISNHADQLIGFGEFRKFSLTTIERGHKGDYLRKKVRGIPGCTHVLIYESNLTGWTPYYPLGGDIYLAVRNG